MKRIFPLIFMLAIAISFSFINSEDSKTEGYMVGDVATDFSLKSTDGDMVSMADYPDAKGFIIVFTCNHCPYAIMYEDRLVALAERQKANGYQVIAINPNDPEVVPSDGFDEMGVRAKEKGFNFPYVFDKGQEIFPQYGAKKTPHVYLLDNKRVVQYVGAIDDNARNAEAVTINYVDNAIDALKEGKAIDPSSTKAIGCSIKVKKS